MYSEFDFNSQKSNVTTLSNSFYRKYQHLREVTKLLPGHARLTREVHEVLIANGYVLYIV